MLQPTASNRPSIDEVLASPWMQGTMLSEQQVRAEMLERAEQLKGNFD